MRMNQHERRFDYAGFGRAIKLAREKRGWTQAHVAELVERDSRTIMNIENKGQKPSFNLLLKLITLFEISVDQFIYSDEHQPESHRRKHIEIMMSSMGEKELIVMEATAEGLQRARETEDA